MLRFYYSPSYKYTNRQVVDLSNDRSFVVKDYINIDSVDTINGHIIYSLEEAEKVPTYIVDLDTLRRYYVSGITQLRTGKFQLSLIRDIISESTTWKSEQAYINAGTATNHNKYKTWGLPFTNTKVREERLNINGKSSFFVYYVNTQKVEGNVLSESDLQIKSTSIPGITGYDFELNDLNEIPNFNFVGAGNIRYFKSNTTSINLYGNYEGFSEEDVTSSVGNFVYNFNNSTISHTKGSYTQNNSLIIGKSAYPSSRILIKGKSRGTGVVNNENNSLNDLQSVLINYTNQYYVDNGKNAELVQINNLSKYVGKIIFNKKDSKVYRINESKSTNNKNIANSNVDALIGSLRGINWPQGGPWDTYTQNGNWVNINTIEYNSTYTLEELGTASGFEFNFTKDTRKLPKSAVRCVNIVASDTVSDEEIAQSLMLAQTNGINEKGDTGRILDIQYLPFSVATKTNDKIKINSTPVIAQFLEADDYEYSVDLPDLKNINKETDTVKIVSPSRASQFVFRPYNNDGNMKFNTKITLKPNASIIYIRPSTQGLLITDWDDKDCLVIQEDFSLTNVTSVWTNYIYNNRNYQNTFNRDIQGREFQRGWERRIEQANARADEWNSRNMSATKAKTYTGNIPFISGIAGGIGTAFKDETYMQMAQLDREYNEALYQESLSLARDNFKLQLENIQSQPNIPTSITTIDVKLLDGVYLEFYSTNNTELRDIERFYKYNGNRIDAYGTFNEYMGNFVRGKIIISNNYTQPELDELNRRLQTGIFMEV